MSIVQACKGNKVRVAYTGDDKVVGGYAYLTPVNMRAITEPEATKLGDRVRTGKVVRYNPETGEIETEHSVFLRAKT